MMLRKIILLALCIAFYTTGIGQATVHIPNVDEFYVIEASFGIDLAEEITSEVILVNDGIEVTSDACSSTSNNVADKIALIDRGSCTFLEKALNAQMAGAIAVIIANNEENSPTQLFIPGGDDMAQVRIPVLASNYNLGSLLKRRLMTGNLSISLLPSPNNLCVEAYPIYPGRHIAPMITQDPVLNDLGGKPSHPENATASIWYTFTPTQTGLMTVSTCNGGADTRAWIHTGNCDALGLNLVTIAENDDACTFRANVADELVASIVEARVEANTTYYIEFDNRWDNSGFTFNLEFNESSCAPITPPQAINSEITLCAGDLIPSISVETTGLEDNDEIRWYTTATEGMPIATGNSFSATAPGTYYAEIFNTNTGCISPRTAIRIIRLPNPVASIQGEAQVCAGENTSLSAMLQDGDASTFLWSNASTNPSITVGAGSYSVTLTDSNGCQSIASKRVEQKPFPSITFPAAPMCAEDNESYSVRLNTEADNTISTSAGVITGGGGFITIKEIAVGVSITVQVVNPAGCELGRILAAPNCEVDEVDCSGSNATISGDLEVCEGERTVLTASGGISYRWSNYAQSDKVGVLAGEYTVTVTDELGCQTIVTATIVEIDCSVPCPPKAAPRSTGDKQVCDNEAIPSLSVTNAGVNLTSEIRWYVSATDSMLIAIGNSFTPTEAGTYYAEIYDTSNDCPSPRTAVTLTIIECEDNVSTTSIDEVAPSFSVLRVQPNPFQEETAIVFEQVNNDWVEIVLYDVAGRTIYQQRTYYKIGTQHWKIDSEILGESGIYFYRLQSSTQTAVGKLILQE